MPHVKLIEREIVITKLLSSNNSEERKKGISNLKTWLKSTSYLKLDESHYERIWTGLFYYYWMSDKPLVQEACAERIGKLINCASTSEAAMKYVKGFFSMLGDNFNSISHHRTEKFLMFVRRFLRHCLFWLNDRQWDEQFVNDFSQQIYHSQQILPFSLLSHLNGIFNEEVAKVSQGKISTKQLISLLRGYVQCVTNLQPNMRSVNDILCRVFSPLCKQLKFYLKSKYAGCDQENSPTDQLVDKTNSTTHVPLEGDPPDEEYCLDDETKPFDPRPGHVDVVLPFIEFDENEIIQFLDEECNNEWVTLKAKNIIQQIKNMLKSISSVREICNRKNVDKTDRREVEVKPSDNKPVCVRAIMHKKNKKSNGNVKRLLRELGDVIQVQQKGSGSRVLLRKYITKNSSDKSEITEDFPMKQTNVSFQGDINQSELKKMKRTNSTINSNFQEFTKEEVSNGNMDDISASDDKEECITSLRNDNFETVIRNFRQDEFSEIINDETSVDCSNKFRTAETDGTSVQEETNANEISTCFPIYMEQSEITPEQNRKTDHLTNQDDNNRSSTVFDDKLEDDNDERIIMSSGNDNSDVVIPDDDTEIIDGDDNIDADNAVISNDPEITTDNEITEDVINESEENPIVLTNDSEQWNLVPEETLSELKNIVRNQSLNSNVVAVKGKKRLISTNGLAANKKHKVFFTLDSKCIRNNESSNSDVPAIKTKKWLKSKKDSAGLDRKQKVIFALNQNSAQGFQEYRKNIKLHPAVPYDSNKQPGKSLLKSLPISTPCNPFYKIKSKMPKIKTSNASKKKSAKGRTVKNKKLSDASATPTKGQVTKSKKSAICRKKKQAKT